MSFSHRRRILQNHVGRSKTCDAFFVSHPVNVRYLTGFESSNAYLLITRNATTLFTDARYGPAAEECAAREDITLIIIKKAIEKELPKYAKEDGIQHIAFEDSHLTVAAFKKYKKAAPRLTWVPVDPRWMGDIRTCKSDEEKGMILAAVHIAEKAFRSIPKKKWVGMTEIDASDLLEEKVRAEARARGLHAYPSFGYIVAFGPHAAVPHHHPTHTRIGPHGMLKIDWGARVDGYCSDMTRTLYFGRPDARFREVYATVLAANRAAIAAVKPGVALKTIDAAARDLIVKAGYGDYFGHGTGHGVGMEIHEELRVAPGVARRARAGMVITIEPGIYIPGWGGVRIEDMVMVTRDGAQVLTSLPV